MVNNLFISIFSSTPPPQISNYQLPIKHSMVQHGGQGKGRSGCFLEHKWIEFVLGSGHAEPQVARVSLIREGLSIHHQRTMVSRGRRVSCIAGLGNIDGQFVGLAVLESDSDGLSEAPERLREVADIVRKLDGRDGCVNKGWWVALGCEGVHQVSDEEVEEERWQGVPLPETHVGGERLTEPWYGMRPGWTYFPLVYRTVVPDPRRTAYGGGEGGWRCHRPFAGW